MRINLKIIILSLVLVVFYLHPVKAQDVPPVYGIDTIIYDQSTKGMTVKALQVKIGENQSKDGITVYLQKKRVNDQTFKYIYYLSVFSDMDLGCSGAADNYLKIKLENGDVIKLEKDLAKTNCLKPVESTYELQGTVLEKLKYTKVESIKIKQSKYYADFSIRYPDCIIKFLQLLGKYT